MLADKDLNKLVNQLLAKHEFSFTKDYVTIDGEKHRHIGFGKEYIAPILIDNGHTSFFLEDFKDQKSFYKEITNTLRRKHKESLEQSFNFSSLPETNLDFNGFIPLVDVKSDEMLLFNTEEKILSDLNIKTWERSVPPNLRNVCYDNLRHVVLGYDPYNLETMVPMDFEGYNVLKVNTYRPPKWRFNESPLKAKCPELIERVLKHLFPDQDCLEFIINWIYISLVERNETYLVLNGAKGVGKGVFCSILSALVGRENYAEAPFSLVTERFNAVLDNKRVVNMDEFKVGKAEHTKLKRFINKFQNIEKKGIDADSDTEIYNSYVVSNNDVSDMHIEYDDRRFSVPDLSKKPLLGSLSQKEIDSLHERLESDEDFITQFGYWIFNYGKSGNYNSFSFWSGPLFNEMVYHSLYEWQKFILDKVISGEYEELKISSLNREFSKDSDKYARFPRNIKKVDDFIKNYQHKGVNILGTVEKSDGSWYIMCDSHWIGDDTKNREVESIELF